jgi:hypothetical protein
MNSKPGIRTKMRRTDMHYEKYYVSTSVAGIEVKGENARHKN